MLKNTLLLYSLILLLSVFGGGGIIRIYGDTCGISLFDPGDWGRVFILMGSPWCRGLNWLGYATTSIVENIWYHTISNIAGYVLLNIPNSNIIVDNVSRSIVPGKLDFSVD
jgi:hypothetical protein